MVSILDLVFLDPCKCFAPQGRSASTFIPISWLFIAYFAPKPALRVFSYQFYGIFAPQGRSASIFLPLSWLFMGFSCPKGELSGYFHTNFMTFKKVLRYISLSEYSHPNFLTFHRIWCPAGPLGGDFHTHFMNVLYRKAAQLDFIQILLTLKFATKKMSEMDMLATSRPKSRQKWRSWCPSAKNIWKLDILAASRTKSCRKQKL